MRITVEIKNVYGNEMVYPVCASAKAFAEIARMKTLDFRVLALIRSLGYTIETRTSVLSF